MHFIADPVAYLLRHGTIVLFTAVLVEEAGLPIPAVPWLLAAGALVGQGKLSAFATIAAGTAAATLGDSIWYFLGRSQGNKILNLLCRISLEPDTCVGTTKEMFERQGPKSLMLGKFIPAVGTVMPPLAGIFEIGLFEFLAWDVAGSLMFVASYGALGYLFSNKFARVEQLAENMGFSLLILLAAAVVGYVVYKWVRRRLFFKRLMSARISADELHQLMEAGQEVLIYDVRSALDLKVSPKMIHGARWIAREDFSKRHVEIPRDREVVLYCACPNEASAAAVAKLLQDHGISRVRPLKGGIEAWIEQDFPTDLAPLQLPAAAAN